MPSCNEEQGTRMDAPRCENERGFSGFLVGRRLCHNQGAIKYNVVLLIKTNEF